jgi:mannan endo-1,4-beta-mannosidase
VLPIRVRLRWPEVAVTCAATEVDREERDRIRGRGAAPAHAAVGLHVSGTQIVEGNGSNFIMRGVNHPHVWFPQQTSSFANIKSFGTNTVRVVLGSGQRWGPNPASEVTSVIALCKQNRLICVLEAHDTTGFGEDGAAATLDQAASYWISVASALQGQENFVVINIGNEPFGNNAQVNTGWASATTNAIRRLRTAGLQHLIMVDAPNWGQDWQFGMRDNAAAVFASDPQRNTVFSIHMYAVFSTAASITSYLDAFRTAGLPLVIGEFGASFPGGDPDEDTMMAQAQGRGLGYIGWSWSGNSGGNEPLDMVLNFNPATPTAWGTRILNGANGIRQTSREATIYSGGMPDNTPPTAPGTPSVSGVTSSGANLSWAASTDAGGSGLAGYNVYREQGATDPILSSPTTNSVTLTGLTPSTQYQVFIRARDGAGNLSTPSAAITFTTQAGPTGTCRVTDTVNAWNTGLTSNFSITNTGTAAINGWSLVFTLPSGQVITNGWNATYTPTSGQVTARNVSYNGTINPGATVGDFGFQATHTGNSSKPTAFTLNGSPCTIG